MKFGKSLIRVVELSDPEWGPYWINYKFLKKKIKEIVEARGGVKTVKRPAGKSAAATHPSEISKSAREVEFFLQLKSELKKTSDFFASTEQLYTIRKTRVWEALNMLRDAGVVHDKNTWTRLLMACVNFYKDVLLLENFAIMSYCGFSKILKKHDKMTGFTTREAFMRNVVNQQNFTHYPYVLDLLAQSEKLFADIQGMESVMPLQDEERLFIEAIRDLNYQASRLQSEERLGTDACVAVSDAAAAAVAVGSPNGKEPSTAVLSPSTTATRSSGKVAASASSSKRAPAMQKMAANKRGGEATATAEVRKTTSFNPYHGPSFLTAIPDSSTPYISSMCVVDASDRLDSATSLVIDAALRLSHSAAHTPNLHSIVSWVSHPAADNRKQQDAVNDTCTAGAMSRSGETVSTSHSINVQLNGVLANRTVSSTKLIDPEGAKKKRTLEVSTAESDSSTSSTPQSSPAGAKQQRLL